ncbi:MAG TPA: diaminobutyrate--2-oxoglutarate transaminase family protein [Gaiellaceae bacterium]|nr:diaminobutyrate--2-oxoglutarate transaminase family protein [Gaiellaceae bacterium]
MSPIAPQPAVRTPIPGPESRRLLDRQAERESNARTYPRRLPIGIARAQGSYIEDVDGNVFIDFLTGAGVLALGHNHPEVVEAVERQLHVLVHGLDFPTPLKDEFVELQLSLLPESMRNRMKIQFCGPAGANAVDAALKLCKTATGRGEIVAFQGAFHGSTHSAMAVTGLVSQKAPIANAMPGVHFFPYPRRGALPGCEEVGVGEACAQYLRAVLTDPYGGIPIPAAVIMEVVQAEGGVIPAPTEFVQGVREVTSELGVPLIVDEIQTGCGRTGTWFSFEQHDIVPDVILASKALGGIGMPIAVIFYDKHLDTWAPGAHTGTFRGYQPALAAGIAAVKIIQRDRVLENVREQSAYTVRRLRELESRHECVGDVRGLGLMLGLEIVDPDTGEPDSELALAIQRGALERGLILELGGRYDCIVRLLPPLNVSRETMDQALTILDETLASAARVQIAQLAAAR